MKPLRLRFEQPGTGAGPGWRLHARSATRWQRWALAASLGLTGMVCVVLAQRLWLAQTELAEATAALQAASTNSNTTRTATTQARAALPAHERAAWALLVGSLNTPWNGVFDMLESAIPDDVALMSIEPDAARASLRLEAEAASLDALLQGARALAEAPGVERLTLVKHETQAQLPGAPVRLVMDVRLERGSP